MMDVFTRVPEPLMGVAATLLIWFGFHYAVLAPRAMDRVYHAEILPRCEAVLAARDAPSLPPKIGLGRLLGIPELDVLEEAVMREASPKPVSEAQRTASCRCGAAAAQADIRLRYTLHTASFRLINPEISLWQGAAIRAAQSAVCVTASWR